MIIEAQETDSGNRIERILDIYLRVVSGLLLLLGLRQWAIILGVVDGAGGTFEAMSTPWRLATIHLAVADLVAAVGLWQRAAWGKVLWIYAALAEIAMHTVFAATYGYNLPIVFFHIVAIATFVVLALLAQHLVHDRPGES